jgi:hypothetical protein
MAAFISTYPVQREASILGSEKFTNTSTSWTPRVLIHSQKTTAQSVGDYRFSQERDAPQVRCPAEIHTSALSLASESFIRSTPMRGKPESLPLARLLPLKARILQVADIYDALLMTAQYSDSL